MSNKIIFLLLSAFITSTAFADPTVTFNPPLTVGMVEHFLLMDGGNDVTSNYRIQSISPDMVTGYTPAHSSTAIRANQPGSFTITYVSNIDGTTFSNPANYTSSPAYVQLVSGAGQSANTGAPLAQPIQVQISDGSGNPISGATVTWSITANGGTFSSPSISNSSGIASTTLTMGSTPGTYSVTATAGSITSSDLIQATANPTANQLSNLTITSQPSPMAQQNLIFPTQPILSLTNGSGATYNIATPVSVTAFRNSACTSPAGGNLGGTTTITSSAGTATFTNLNYSANEAIFLKFSAGSVSVCSNQVSVAQPATAATKLALNYTPTSSFAQAPFNLLVNVTDDAGNIIVSATNPISLAAFTDATCTTLATGTLSNGTANAYQGQALFNSLTYSIPDNIYIQATSSGLTSVCSSQISINKNPTYTPASLAFYSAPTSEFSGQLFGTQPFTFVKNSVGSIYQGATSVPITISAYSDSTCTTAASGTLSGGILNNSVFGVGAFTNLSYTGSGTIYLGISSPGLTSACSPALTMTGTPANLASQIKFLTAPPSSAVLNTFLTTQPSIEIDDSTGTVVPGVQGYVALNWFTDSSCTTPAPGAGEADSRLVNGKAQFSYIGSTSVGVYYLKASFNNIAPACSSAITVTSTACTASQHINLTSYSCDANSKDCSSSILNSSVATQTWSGSSYGLCTVSSCLAGFNNESNSCLSAVAITPATGSVVAGKTLQLTASGGDSTYTWSVDQGTVSSSGLFTAPAGAGTSIVTVKDSHNISATSTITVLSSLAMTPKSSTLTKGSTLQMVVSGGSAPFTYTATGGTVNSTGLFTSGNTLGSASVTVTDSSGSTATSNLTIILGDGSLDPSFNANGQVLSDLSAIAGTSSSMNPSTADVGSDGSVYLGAYYYSGSYTTTIVKYNSSGALDSTFGSNGALSIPGFYSPKIKALASGDFLLIMQTYPSPYATVVRRYTSSGTLVSSFGTSGNTSFNYSYNAASYNSYVQKASIDSSDNLYLISYDYTGSTNEIRAIKINSSGTIVYSKSIYSLSSPSADTGSLGVDSSNGKMVISMNVYSTPRSNYVYVLDSSGALDSTFNSGSPLLLPATNPTTYTTYGVRANADGSFLVFGQKDNTYPNSGIVMKVSSSGSIDTTFGTGGVLTGNFGVSAGSSASLQLMNTTGNKMLTTEGSGGMGSIYSAYLLRTNMDGSVDTSFNGGTAINQATYMPAATSYSLNYIDTLVGINGKITAVSYYYDSSSSKYQTLISRYTSTLTNGPIPILASSTFVWGQSQQLSGVGGTGPYTYAVTAGDGSIDTNGIFTAGMTSGSVTIQITDSTGATGTTKVNVIKFSIVASASKKYPGQTATVSVATGTATPPYTYSLVSNNSGGSITSGGIYTAGTTYGVSDTIKLTDASGNSNTASISVAKAITISPTTLATGSTKPTTFTASGGSTTGYTYSLSINTGIGSTINSSTGAYVAGTNSNATPVAEEIKVVDSEGNITYAEISVVRLSGAIISTGTNTLPSSFKTTSWGTIGTPMFQSSTKKLIVPFLYYDPSYNQYGLVERLNADGTLDSTYGTANNGGYYANLNTMGNNYGWQSTAMDSSDRLYILIQQSGYLFKIMRLTANGALDTSFGSSGVTQFYQASPMMNGCNTSFIKINKVGQVQMMASCATSSNQYYMVSARINSNGSMDNTYGTNGMLFITDASSTFGYATGTSFNLLSDNSMIYTVEHVVSGTYYYGLYHLNVNGSIDSTFNGNTGVINFPYYYGTVASVDSADNIYVYNGNASYASPTIVSYTKTGALNTAFGGTGTVNVSGDNVAQIIPTSSYLYIGGRLTIGRLSYSGVLDTTFGTALSPSVGFTTLPNGGMNTLIGLPNGDIEVSSGSLAIESVSELKNY